MCVPGVKGMRVWEHSCEVLIIYIYITGVFCTITKQQRCVCAFFFSNTAFMILLLKALHICSDKTQQDRMGQVEFYWHLLTEKFNTPNLSVFLTGQLLLLGPIADGVRQRSQPVLHPWTQLEEAGVLDRQSGEGFGMKEEHVIWTAVHLLPHLMRHSIKERQTCC